jgi:hypothetical protein
MRSLEAIEPDPARLRRELDELEQFLSTGAPLKEREHVAPFFKKRPQLAAALGFACNEVQYVDRFAIELGLFGDFACDVASGDSDANAFTLVEFESAEPYTIFARAKPGSVRSWAPRFEHGGSRNSSIGFGGFKARVRASRFAESSATTLRTCICCS